MIAMRAIFMLLAVMLSFLPSHPAGAEPAAAYYPLEPGMVWEYTVVSSKAGTRRITIKNLPARELDGRKVTPREWQTGESVKYYLVARDDYGVYRYGEQKSKDAAPEVITPKVYYLKEPVDRGTTWDIVTHMGDRQIKVNLTVEGINEVITVPGGTYKNCVKIKHEGEGQPGKDQAGFGVTAYEWYAPGTGLVKSMVTIKEKSKEAKAPETMTYQLDRLQR
jgi:hypothetical protein